jgi:hypothetical protein
MQKILLFKFPCTLKRHVIALALKSFKSPWSISITSILTIMREFS